MNNSCSIDDKGNKPRLTKTAVSWWFQHHTCRHLPDTVVQRFQPQVLIRTFPEGNAICSSDSSLFCSQVTFTCFTCIATSLHGSHDFVTLISNLWLHGLYSAKCFPNTHIEPSVRTSIFATGAICCVCISQVGLQRNTLSEGQLCLVLRSMSTVSRKSEVAFLPPPAKHVLKAHKFLTVAMATFFLHPKMHLMVLPARVSQLATPNFSLCEERKLFGNCLIRKNVHISSHSSTNGTFLSLQNFYVCPV